MRELARWCATQQLIRRRLLTASPQPKQVIIDTLLVHPVKRTESLVYHHARSAAQEEHVPSPTTDARGPHVSHLCGAAKLIAMLVSPLRLSIVAFNCREAEMPQGVQFICFGNTIVVDAVNAPLTLVVLELLFEVFP